MRHAATLRLRNDPRTKRALPFLIVTIALAAARAFADIDLAGEWNVTFTGPQGPADYTMYIAQEGTRLTGRLTSPHGELPLEGTVEGEKADRFRIAWSLPDAGRVLDIVFVGTVEGDTLAGTARLGKAGAR
jgi:hypothetical protein